MTEKLISNLNDIFSCVFFNSLKMLDISFLVISTLACLIVTILNLLSYLVLSGKDFKGNKIYRYLAANSAVDALSVILSIGVPYIMYFQFINHSLSRNYYILFYEHFVIRFFLSIVKSLSNYLNVAITFYRYFEITNRSHLNKKLKFKRVFLFLIFLSLLTTGPLLGIRKIVETNNRQYAKSDANLTIYGYDYKQTVVTWRRLHHFIVLILIIIPNIFISINLIKYIKLSKGKLDQIVVENVYLTNTAPDKDCLKNKNELKMTYLVLIISFICIFDTLYKFLTQSLYFIKSYLTLFHYFFYLLLLSLYIFYSANIIVYFIINDAFKFNMCQILKM